MTAAPANSSRGIGGKIFLSLFLGLFLAAGVGFTSVMVRSFLKTAATHGWVAVECTILDSQVVANSKSNDAPTLSVRYRYSYGVREFVSTQQSRGLSSGRDTAEVYRLSQQLTPGSRTTCYVDPAAPEEAVLFRTGLWSGFLILFPLVFVAIGAGGLFFVWRPRPLAAAAISTSIAKQATDTRRSRLGLGLFFTVFLLFGAGFGWGFIVKPLLRLLAAQNWQSVPCTIVSSRVVSHSDSDGTTYSVEVVYRYEIGGREYTAARYKFVSTSSSGYAGKAEIVARLRPGSTATCFVNPRDPTEAVMIRDFTADLWLGLIPLLFVFVGLAGLRWAVFGRALSGATTTSLRMPVAPNAPGAGLTGELRPTHTRVAKLAGFILIALFWNGIVSIFLYHVVAEWHRGKHPWFLTLFLTPFVVIGLFLIAGAIKQALALSNPRPRLTVNPLAVSLGKTCEVAWEMEGKVQALRQLRIFLEGREEATHRRGTDTVTDKHVFTTIEIVDTSDPGTMRLGTGRLAVPANTMHSWVARNNRVVWTLRVRGEIPNWPDIDEEYPLTILPQTQPPA